MSPEYEQLELCLEFDCEAAHEDYACDWSEIERSRDESARSPTHPGPESSGRSGTDLTQLAVQVLATLEQSG